jgi:hypothetical protein
MTVQEPAQITLREVYDAVQELKFELAHTPQTLTDHERRIRDLERKVWSFAGLSAVLATAASQLITALLNKG